MWNRNQNAKGVLENGDETQSNERPAGWTAAQEHALQAVRQADVDTPRLSMATGSSGADLFRRPVLLDATLLKCALLAVTLPQAFVETTDYPQRAELDAAMATLRRRDNNKNALQELLERGGWHHLVSVAFRSRLQTDQWDQKLRETAHDWWLCASEVTTEPHPVNPTPHAREVCVLCGGPLGDTPHVDHWIIKSAFPLLSVCADNLQLICSTCNEAPNKGDEPVHSTGNFVDWFHPHLRPGDGVVQLNYVLSELSVLCSATTPADQPKAAKLDALLNLSSRWTREFKAEYAKHQDVLIRREQRRLQSAQARHTQVEILTYVQRWQADLAASEPHHEVHQTLAAALQEPSRRAAWHSELNLVP